MLYLLDTNALSHVVRNPRGATADRIRKLGNKAIYTSVIVSAEMRFGVARRQSARLAHQVEEVLAAIRIMPLAPPVDHVYGQIRWELEKRGTPIRNNDMLIAAQALHDDATLVTDNVREFGRVPGLKVENWLTD